MIDEIAGIVDDGLFSIMTLRMRVNRSMNASMAQEARACHQHYHKLTCEAVSSCILLFVAYPGVILSDSCSHREALPIRIPLSDRWFR